jgi:xanthine dehydrogenase small subunit
MLRDFAAAAGDRIDVNANVFGQQGHLCSPTDLADGLKFLDRHPTATIVAGATDIGVQINKGVLSPAVVLDLNRIEELEGATIERDGGNAMLVAGARVDWSEIERLCRDDVPELSRIISAFGSPQIRHMGTLGGNIINASPIADSLPFLFVMEAELELQSVRGRRTVPITEFYRCYKQFDLRPGELLVRIAVPLPVENQHLRLYKVSRRRDLDISTFTAAVMLEFEGDRVADAHIALGGVGPTVVRARKSEAFLRGKALTESVMRSVGDVAAGEVAPISDVRGTADYRSQLTRNVFLKYYHQLSQHERFAPTHA